MPVSHGTQEPPDLDLVQDFVNTNDIETPYDELGSPELLRAWLVERGLLPQAASVNAEDQTRTIAVREGLRALGRANNGDQLEVDRLEELNRAATGLPLAARLGVNEWRLTPAVDGVDGFLARILATVLRAMADGSWSRVKACSSDTCRWLFYDRSRNRSRTWCSMAVCGSRMKSRAYRSRSRAAAVS